MNDSIRAYAEQNVIPQFTAIPSLRDGLKNLYPDFNDKDWTDEFTAKIKIEAGEEKAASPCSEPITSSGRKRWSRPSRSSRAGPKTRCGRRRTTMPR